MSCKTKKPSLYNRVKSLVLKSNNRSKLVKSNNRSKLVKSNNKRKPGRKTKKSIKKIATHHYNHSLNKFIKKRASKLN